ncbi:hypothetical protein [Haloarcula argentinensis]|uniref:hypothetical protein n=1 Tax=Haloarcula argentinensis TaxID=43776 RepID=UPI00126957F9|nr:hypothetical protein [Haloarcula argentinensis]
MTDARQTAKQYTNIHTDDEEEAEDLAADEVYAVLAYCRDQLETLGKYHHDLGDVEPELLDAIDELQDGMNQRAIQHAVGEAED